MSGICGIVHFDGAPVAQEELEAMLAAAPHRGRDGTGRWTEGSVALGYLATEVGFPDEYCPQPLVDEETGCALVAHARLDNREELQHVLQQAGIIRAPAAPNPELILAAYRHWGLDCAERIVGDFAFVLWDPRQRRVFAARDPMAMRPLYYRFVDQRLVFASEVKQILALPDVPAKIREESIARHVAGRPQDLARTYFEDIRQLPPARAIVITQDTRRYWKYWDPNPHKRIRYRTEEEYVEHFRELLVAAARVRFRSPQPAGVLLSGGLDSGTVASIGGFLKEGGQLNCPDVHTYSWDFPSFPECDERWISDHIVTEYQLPSTYVDADKFAPLRTYPDYAPDPDGPHMGVYDPLVSAGIKAASNEGAGYLFTGHRGDLVVGEWNFNYFELLIRGRWIALARGLQSHHRLMPNLWYDTWKRYFVNPAKSTLWPRHRFPQFRHVVRGLWHTLKGTADDLPSLPPWMPASLAAFLPRSRELQPVPDGLGGPSREERYRLIMNELHMHVAMVNERLAAKHHMVASDPWTDRRVIQFALAVPQDVLCRGGENKRVTRLALKGIMPEKARQRANKISPEPLYLHSLREHSALILDTLFDNAVSAQRDYIDEDTLRIHYQRFLEGESYDPRLWYPITLEMWLRETPYTRLKGQIPRKTPTRSY